MSDKQTTKLFLDKSEKHESFSFTENTPNEELFEQYLNEKEIMWSLQVEHDLVTYHIVAEPRVIFITDVVYDLITTTDKYDIDELKSLN